MKISGYTTTRNCIEMNYPFRESIRSMLDFCDEVVVADSTDHDDGTIEALQELMDEFPQLNVVHVDVDYSAPNFGVWDGKMKAIARENCSEDSDYLWQFDVDEVVQKGIRPQIEEFISNTFQKFNNIQLVALPVVEYWGSKGKVRVDVNPWKWRLSVNDRNITHGIPAQLRHYKDGLLYAKHGTDGCDYIFQDGSIVPCSHFMTKEIEVLRRTALNGDNVAVKQYEQWFNEVVKNLPTVYHFSWYSIEDKIKKWTKFWNKFWVSLYGEQDDKPAGWNPFLDQPIETITEDQIKLYSEVLETYTGGHIFHTRWNFTKTPSVNIDQPIPEFIQGFRFNK